MRFAHRILRFLDPQKEQERRDFRQCVAMTQASAMDVDRTITMRREEFERLAEKPVVIFSTFADGCTYRVPGVSMRLCRHKNHPEHSQTALAKCDEERCPFMLGVAK